ncbi:hypothetical protein R1sor_019549 [Riccia sorocarpa]|uniref:Uncharacterized protein n=1 Tax=Riccia sorocarpa TaxID=122646 RepID=A0ABD3IFI9_9MARC
MPGLMEVDGQPSMEQLVDRPLFGGAITCRVPARFLDVSDIREVPDNQEVLCDYDREESIIIELLEFKSDVTDEDSARWFLHNVAEEQEAESTVVLESRIVLTVADVPSMPAATVMNAAVGYMTVTKGRQFNPIPNPAVGVGEDPPPEHHLVKAHLADIRLRGVQTDLLITVNQRLDQRPEQQLSEAVDPRTVGVEGYLPPADVLKLILRTLKIEDWTLFECQLMMKFGTSTVIVLLLTKDFTGAALLASSADVDSAVVYMNAFVQ